MSHITTLGLEITDLKAMQAACEVLGLELSLNEKSFRNFGNRCTPCAHAIRVKGNTRAYEMGLVVKPVARGTQATGRPDSYTLAADFWNGGYGLVDVVGHAGSKLLQEYTTQKTVSHWKSKGFAVSVTTDAKTGKRKVSATKVMAG